MKENEELRLGLKWTAPAQDLAVSGARSDAQTMFVNLFICNVGV